MWRMRVIHATGYAYKSPVTASYNEARLTPRSDSRQNVILNRVETVPATRSYRYVDYWGTAVTAFDLHAPHTELEVTRRRWWRPTRGSCRRRSSAGRTCSPQAVIDRFDEYLTRDGVHALEQAHRPRRASASPSTTNRSEAMVEAANWVHTELAYVPAPPGVHSSGLDALREGKGVCQDFAHLTLILLRSMGIPARYVSGYLHPNEKAKVGDTIDGQSHAWMQAWTGGWWNYDPTNDKDDQRAVHQRGRRPRLRRRDAAEGHLLGGGVHRPRRRRGDHPAGLTPWPQPPGARRPGAGRRPVRSGD